MPNPADSGKPRQESDLAATATELFYDMDYRVPSPQRNTSAAKTSCGCLDKFSGGRRQLYRGLVVDTCKQMCEILDRILMQRLEDPEHHPFAGNVSLMMQIFLTGILRN